MDRQYFTALREEVRKHHWLTQQTYFDFDSQMHLVHQISSLAFDNSTVQLSTIIARLCVLLDAVEANSVDNLSDEQLTDRMYFHRLAQNQVDKRACIQQGCICLLTASISNQVRLAHCLDYMLQLAVGEGLDVIADLQQSPIFQ